MQATIPRVQEHSEPQESVTIVDRDYLPMVKGTSLRDWVRNKYVMEGMSDDLLTIKMAILQKEKTEVRKIAREYIHYFFVEALKNKGVLNVKTIQDIKKYWLENKTSDTGINIMKYVLYGYFDEKKIGISCWKVKYYN